MKDAIVKADLIHLHGLWLYPHFVASRAAWVTCKPYVVSPHGMMSRWALSQAAFKKRIYADLIEWRTLRRAATIHAVSESEAKDIRQLGFSSPIVTIPNGISPTEFSNLPDGSVFRHKYPMLAGKTVLLFLGRIHPKKGLDLLVRSFCRVTKERPNTVLVVAGPDERGYQKHLESRLHAEGFLNRCIFTGMLQPTERLSALAGSDIFVLPSYSEGFPIAPIEALAAGLPVVLTEACNIPDIEEAGAGIVITPEIGSLTEAMLLLINNTALRRRMGVKGRELALAKYTWDRVAARMTEVYKNILLPQKAEYLPKAQLA
jgi:glycosyltransferase involved in cell wall biosynthesis